MHLFLSNYGHLFSNYGHLSNYGHQLIAFLGTLI